VDSGVRAGWEVSTSYDPMLAKVIAHAPTRDQAARLLARALSESRILGVVTNRDLLVGILREQEFRQGRIDTGYLTRHDPVELMAAPEAAIPVHTLAIALADQAERRLSSPVLPGAPSGWRNVPNAAPRADFQLGDRTIAVEYRLRGTRVAASVDGAPLTDVVLHACTPDSVDLQVAGVRRVVRVARSDRDRYADSVLGSTHLTEQVRFPEPGAQTAAGSLVAPMPGTVVRIGAELGQTVAEGSVVLVLEAMKMEHAVRAPHDGVITQLGVALGEAVGLGTVLAVVSEVGA
jgi:acetyl/propionyl-CoA carboxylase alpha subunit